MQESGCVFQVGNGQANLKILGMFAADRKPCKIKRRPCLCKLGNGTTMVNQLKHVHYILSNITELRNE